MVTHAVELFTHSLTNHFVHHQFVCRRFGRVDFLVEVNGVRKLNYWRSNGWMTRRGERVANVDLWEKVYLPSRCEMSLVSGTDVVFGNNIV